VATSRQEGIGRDERVRESVREGKRKRERKVE